MRRIIYLLLFSLSISARPANPLSVWIDFLIGVYQRLFSPLQGRNVCNFSPSCSKFSREAYARYGPFWGTLMTFDRLERCNPGAWHYLYIYYSHIENGRLADPPENHYLPLRLKKIYAKKDTL